MKTNAINVAGRDPDLSALSIGNTDFEDVTVQAERDSGSLTGTDIGDQFEITACETDHFFVGNQVGNVFVCSSETALDSNNKVKRWYSNDWGIYFLYGSKDGDSTFSLADADGLIDDVNDTADRIRIYNAAGDMSFVYQTIEQDEEYYYEGRFIQHSGGDVYVYNGNTSHLIDCSDLPKSFSGFMNAESFSGFYLIGIGVEPNTEITVDYFRAWKVLND